MLSSTSFHRVSYPGWNVVSFAREKASLGCLLRDEQTGRDRKGFNIQRPLSLMGQPKSAVCRYPNGSRFYAASQFLSFTGRGTYVKIKSLGGVNMVKLNKLWEARSRLYRRQILQINIRWKALVEIYKICMLLHRSPQYVSKISSNFLAFSKLDILKSSIFSNFVVIFTDFHEICSDFLRFYLKCGKTLQLITRNFSTSI